MSDPAGDDRNRRSVVDDGALDGRGIFDCPMADCDVVLVGDYGDLLAHLDREHPLSRTVVDGDGTSIRGRVAAARERVREEAGRPDAAATPEPTPPRESESSGAEGGDRGSG